MKLKRGFGGVFELIRGTYPEGALLWFYLFIHLFIYRSRIFSASYLNSTHKGASRTFLTQARCCPDFQQARAFQDCERPLTRRSQLPQSCRDSGVVWVWSGAEKPLAGHAPGREELSVLEGESPVGGPKGRSWKETMWACVRADAPQNCPRIPKEASASGFLRPKDNHGLLDGCAHA